MSHYQPQPIDKLDLAETFTAGGGWGKLYCDLTSGDVVHYERYGEWQKPGDGYDDIVRLDVAEWHAFYPGEDITLGHDILDFGSWDKAGTYSEPEMDFREECKRIREQD